MVNVGVSILGGTGYGAGELMRLLVHHPHVQVASVVSSSSAGQKVSDVHPHLRGFYDFAMKEQFAFEDLAAFEHQIVVLALPHGASHAAVSGLRSDARSTRLKIIDLSGDFRLQSKSARDKHYPAEGEWISAVYGIPEINREVIRSAQLVANPGCFASTCILAVRPLANLNIHQSIHFDGKSGSSGAGKTPQPAFHHPHCHSNSFAYKVLEHRHEPEIAEGLGVDAEGISFVPHVIPAARGIYATACVTLHTAISQQDLEAEYARFYSRSPFIRLMSTPPDLHGVIGSNFCDIMVRVRDKTVIAMATLDNLIKGMCGSAVQNLNLLCGFEETVGLWYPSIGPV